MSLLARLRRMFRVRKPADTPHEHQWASLGVFRYDMSLTPSVVLVCECGAWTTADLQGHSRVEYEPSEWRFRPPESLDFPEATA